MRTNALSGMSAGTMTTDAWAISTASPAKSGNSKVQTRYDSRVGEEGWRVVWIDWDSGFRRTGLRVGDRVIGDHQGLYDEEAIEKGYVFGAHSESRRWSDIGVGDGDKVILMVQRRGEVVRVEGRLEANHSYRNADGKRSFGEDGPTHHTKDGFQYAWHPWYSNFTKLAETVLCGWDYTVGYDTVRLAEQMEPFAERVQYLQQHYPGPFADAVVEDWQAMRTMVAGEPREVREADLEYRKLGDIRAKQVTAAADAAFEQFLADFGDDLLPEPFPAPHPFQNGYAHLIGKVVALPEVSDRDGLLYETKRSWYRVGRSQGVYLIDRHGDTIKAFYDGSSEYVEKVNPYLKKRRIRFVGVIEPLPALVSDAVRNITLVGLKVKPIAALVADDANPESRFFVDMRPDRKTEEAFAGEAALVGMNGARLTPDDAPADVMRVFFDCLKVANFEEWRQCFAGWRVRRSYERDNSHLYVDLTWTTLNDRDAVSIWDRSRQRLLEDVFAVEVAEVSAARVVYDASERPAGQVEDNPNPRIVEEVRVRVNHIGRFGEEYRTFASNRLHRNWTLQRLDDDPWRIIEAQEI